MGRTTKTEKKAEEKKEKNGRKGLKKIKGRTATERKKNLTETRRRDRKE